MAQSTIIKAPTLQTYMISETTSASGALEIPSELRSYELLSFRYSGQQQGNVFRRDPRYLHCTNTDGTAKASTAVVVVVSYMAVSPVL